MTLTLKDLPMPPTSGLLGHISFLKQSNIHKQLLDWSQSYGATYRLQLGLKDALVISNKETIQKILKDRPDGFRRLSVVENRFDEIGMNGVFSSEGEKWRQNRKLSDAIFLPKHIKNFTPILVKITQRLHERFSSLAASKEPVDLLKEFRRYTVDVTTNLAFGEDINSLGLSQTQLEKSLELVFPMLNQRCQKPFPFWRYFKTKADKKFEAAIGFITQQIQAFIEHQKKILRQSPDLMKQPQNMLQIMIVAQQEHADISDKDIIANALTMLIAGEDTTANTLTWMACLIAERQDTTLRLRDELKSADFKIEDSAIKLRLPFLNAIAFETMRLKPVAQKMYVEPITDHIIEDMKIPAGTPIFILLNACAFDENTFQTPQEFDPMRWYGDDANTTSQILPFGAGSRMCPGRSLALTEIKLAFATLISKFETTPLQPTDSVEEHFAFTMSPDTFFCRLAAL